MSMKYDSLVEDFNGRKTKKVEKAKLTYRKVAASGGGVLFPSGSNPELDQAWEMK